MPAGSTAPAQGERSPAEPARAPASNDSAGPDLRLVPAPAPGRPFDFATDGFAGGGAEAAPAPSSTPTSPATTSASTATPVRRTVPIKGRGAERNMPWEAGISSRRSTRLPHHRSTFRPDRLAMWAVVLGLLLVLVAAMSAH